MAAVFIIAVLALLGTSMVFLGVLERETVSAAAQGARAYHAARSGVEAGLFLATVNGNCPATNNYDFSTVPGLTGFAVAVNCSFTAHRERGTDYNVYLITSTATFGTFGHPEYVQRQLRITATNASTP